MMQSTLFLLYYTLKKKLNHRNSLVMTASSRLLSKRKPWRPIVVSLINITALPINNFSTIAFTHQTHTIFRLECDSSSIERDSKVEIIINLYSVDLITSKKLMKLRRETYNYFFLKKKVCRRRRGEKNNLFQIEVSTNYVFKIER